MGRKIFILIFILQFLSFLTGAAFGITAELKSFLQDYPTVRFYIEMKNSTSDDKVDKDILKKLLEDGLLARKSHRFVKAEKIEDADLVIKGDIVEYAWAQTDPLDEVWGVGAAAADAVILDNYARMQVRVELIKAKNKSVIWSDKIQSNVTQHVMPKDSSYELVYNRFVKSFMITIFKKRAG